MVAQMAARVVLVRDTTDRDGQTPAFTAEAWRAFAEELKLLASAWKSPVRTEHPSRYPEATTASRVPRPQIVGVLAVPGGSDHFPAFIWIHGHLRLYLPLGQPEDLGRP